MADFEAVEARLRSILDPYRDRPESNDVSGVATLQRPGGSRTTSSLACASASATSATT